MDDATRKALERPFPPEQFKKRQGQGGKVFTYVEVGAFIARLNQALAGAWSFEIVRREQVEDQILIEGRLTVGSVVKTCLGGAVVTRRRDDGRLVSLSGNHKMAESDALKRCCRLLGVGGHATASDGEDDVAVVDDDNEPTEEPVVVRDPRHPEPPPRLPAASPSPPLFGAHASPTRSRLTSKQLGALWAISAKLGMDQRAFRAHVRGLYLVQPEFLTRDQASAIISKMGNGTSANGNGREHASRAPGEDG